MLFSQFLRFLKGSQVKECVKVLRSFCISLSTLLHNIFSFIPARRNYKESHFVALRGINNMMLAGWLAAWASDKCCFHFEITIFHSVHTKKTSSASSLFHQPFVSVEILEQKNSFCVPRSQKSLSGVEYMIGHREIKLRQFRLSTLKNLSIERSNLIESSNCDSDQSRIGSHALRFGKSEIRLWKHELSLLEPFRYQPAACRLVT